MKRKIYVAGTYHPWRNVDLNINIGVAFQGALDGSDGFLPVFEHYEDALKAYPDRMIFEMIVVTGEKSP